MSGIDLNSSKIERLCDALEKPNFQKTLIGIRDAIENEIKSFIKSFKKDNLNIKVSDAIESRIKSRKSLEEKLERKNYINIWNIDENPNHHSELLATKLPDLIGLRINCYFKDDESKLFDALMKYKFTFVLKDDSTHNEKTGYHLYKANGKYDTGPICYNFEIQVKSTMNSLWSEVQHDTIYKKKGFDVSYDLKKKLTDDLEKKISASDSSLKSIYFQKYEVNNLIQALFYEYTKDIISSKHKTSFLGNHYDTFYDLMNDKLLSTNALEKYCGMHLLTQEYKRIDYPVKKVSKKEKEFSQILKNEYYPFYFEVFETIFDLLFNKPKNLTIYEIISKQIINPLDMDYDDEEDNMFDDEESNNQKSELDIFKERASSIFKK